MPTRSKAEYEKRLLNEIQDLPESEITKILKLIHFLKAEIFEKEKRE